MKRHLLAVSLSLVALSACEHTRRTVPSDENHATLHVGDPDMPPHLQPQSDHGGVVIAESELQSGSELPLAEAETMQLTDCEGESFGVKVDSTTEEEEFFYDGRGKPCDTAETVFDGNTRANQRAASTDVNIRFLDSIGPLPASTRETVETLLPGETRVAPQNPEQFAMAPEGTPAVTGGLEIPVEGAGAAAAGMRKPGQIDAIIETEGQLAEARRAAERNQRTRELLLKEAEYLLADVRSVQRLSSEELLKAHQGKINELSARLREAQREAAMQQVRQEELLAQLAQLRARTEAGMNMKEQESRQLRSDLEAMQARLYQFETLNTQLENRLQSREAQLNGQIEQLQANLEVSGRESRGMRQEVVLEAARQLAEAEKAALAAKMAQKEALEREAARLQAEAAQISARADQARAVIHSMDEAKQARMLSMSRAQQPAGRPGLGAHLEAQRLALHADKKPLRRVVEEAFAQIEGTAGAWTISWELDPRHAHIPEERWTVAAEARMDEFLRYVADKVAETHGVVLHFSRFDQNRLFVISEE